MTLNMADRSEEPLNPLYMASANGSLQETLLEMSQAKSAEKAAESIPVDGGGSPAKKAPLLRGSHPPLAGPPSVHHQQPPTLLQPQRQYDTGHHVGPLASVTMQGSPSKQKVGQQQQARPPDQGMTGMAEMVGDQRVGHSAQGSAATTDSEKSSPTESEGSTTSTKTTRVLQKRMSHAAVEKGGELQCPRINCPEKIIICLDLSDEMETVSFKSRAGDKFAPIKLIKRALGFFMNTKRRINVKHEFALVFLRDTALWMCDFTTDPSKIMTLLDDQVNTFKSDNFDMASVFDEVIRHARLPRVPEPKVIPPPYTVRVLLIYGRSRCVPFFSSRESQKQLYLSPHFFIDAYYIHEPPSEENKCDTIFDILCELDENGLSYIHEVSKNPTKLYDSMAQFLPHPLQRPSQTNVSHDLQPRSVDAGQA